MALGHNQKEDLQWFADGMKRGEPKTILIVIRPWRRFSRSPGGYPVLVHFVYNSDQTIDGTRWLSTCAEEYTALDKGKEIGRYLCDTLGLSRDVVKLRAEY